MNGFYLFDKEAGVSNTDSIVVKFDGRNHRNLNDLFSGIALQFRFPDYFNYNFDSLEEMLNDLNWLEDNNFSIIIINYKLLLADEAPERKEIFLQILNDVAAQWEHVPNFEGESNYRHKSDFRIYVENTPAIVNDLNKLGIAYYY